MRPPATYCVRADGLRSWCGRELVGNVTALPVDTFLMSDASMCSGCLGALRATHPGCEIARLR